MKIEITKTELELIIESLSYSKQKFEEYGRYPDEDLKKMRILEAENLIKKLKAEKNLTL